VGGSAFVTFSGGVGDVAATADVKVVFIDWDDFNDRDLDQGGYMDLVDRILTAMTEVEALPKGHSEISVKRWKNLVDLRRLLPEVMERAGLTDVAVCDICKRPVRIVNKGLHFGAWRHDDDDTNATATWCETEDGIERVTVNGVRTGQEQQRI
jgi:hypothetical protein